MSLSPHQIFGRLQELKKWQQTHEKLLQRSDNIEEYERASSNNQFSYQNSGNIRYNSSGNDQQFHLDSPENLEEEFINAPLDKDFEELVEEKLNEFNEYNVPTNNSSVPKKPFLKKGTGLLKYNLNPEEYKNLIGNKYSNSVIPSRGRPKSVEVKKKTVQFQTERPKTTGGVPKRNPPKRTQNTIKPNRTSINTSQRPKTSTSDYSRGSGIQNRQNTKKNSENTKQSEKVLNGKTIIRNGDYLTEKPQSAKNIPKSHPEEPKNCLKVVKNSINSLGHDPPVKEPQETLETNKKCSPNLHEFITNVAKKPVEYTPLKAPEIGIQPRGNWCDSPVDNFRKSVWKNANNDVSQQNDKIFTNDRITAQLMVQSHWKNGFVQQVREVNNVMPEVEKVIDLQERRVPPARKSLSYTSNENSLYERAVETELRIFEALERRTEQSGFCSTNTSIIQLLASTPSKFDFKNTETNTENHVPVEVIEKDEGVEELPGDYRCQEEGSVDDNQMSKFKNYPSSNWYRENEPEADESDEDVETEEEIDKTLEEDLAEEKKSFDNNMEEYFRHRRDSSTNTDNQLNLPSSYSSTSSDMSEEYSADKSKAYRSSRSPSNGKTLDSSESCASCGFLIKNKIEECQSELENLKVEKDKILAIREQMDKDKREFEKEMKLRRIQFEEQKLRYQLEIEEEKKKMTEKPTSEKQIKDVKSKAQHRKDREEINNLRMELNETKELMKLRDTKNAMTVARLRNQVKMLEKNNAELKAENEKLLKEKSKLVAQQRSLNKTTETKMLKEISRNISKLTEKTFENQSFKVDVSSGDSSRKSIKGNARGDSQATTRKSLSNSQGILKNSTQPVEGLEENYIEDRATQDVLESNIEEKYKSLFGGNEVIIEENRRSSSTSSTRAVGLDKTEKILEDGSKEIKYSNGNIKRISENGTVRYYYSSNDTWHTNFPDGTEVIEFPNGQSEKRFKDGKCLIFFPDGLIQTIFPDGTEEVKYPDGSKLLTKKDGDRMLFLANGQVEIHTKDQKRREYPDGTVKILYPDGSQETRYSNGRIRMKNSKGEIVLDTGETNS